MNKIEITPTHFSIEASRTTPLLTRVLRLILKIQDLFHSYVVSPLRNSPLSKSNFLVISQRKQLNSSVLVKISNHLTKKHPQVEIQTSFLFPISGVPNLKTDKTLLLIPIVLKGYLENHIVLLAMDKENKKVLFYDSKGWTLEDHAQSRTTGNISLKDIFKTLSTNNNTQGYTLSQNTERVQKDSHNCGVYVARAMHKLSNNEDPLVSPLSFSEADTEAREKLIQDLSS